MANILSTIEAQYQQMQQTLVAWSEINSGSYHINGLNQIHQELAAYFSQLGEVVNSPAMPDHKVINNLGQAQSIALGKALHIQKNTSAPLRILLCGHMDTVFAKDSPFQQCKMLNDDKLQGPGVADMKGGLLVLFHGLWAVTKSPYNKLFDWEVIITADEEIGSPGSATLLSAAAQRCDVGLVYEPSITPEGMFAGQRKGSGKYTLVVAGTAAHVGRAFEQGRNAIVALAKIVDKIHQLNDKYPKLTVNVGKIIGGDAVNRVPDKAICYLDVRAEQSIDFVTFENDMNNITAQVCQQHEVTCQIHGGVTRAPKILSGKTKALYRGVENVANQLQQSFHCQSTGGCCDGNNLSAAGLPNIDTLGVRGNNIHSDKEYIILPSLIERAQLTALLLIQLATKTIKL